MQIINSTAEMQTISRKWQAGKKVGFVPTMGYLHEGHLSLVKASNEQCEITVVSIFVNPSQFGANEDLGSYPRDIERDLRLLSAYKVDYVFIPEADDMYAKPYHTWVEVQGISEGLCGASRPGHFRGVATVVLKLVNLVKPDLMFMGEKDFQQVAVLKAMLKDLNVSTEIVPCPIVREADGLAMSSRNTFLTGELRQQALCLYKAIGRVKELFAQGINDTMVLHEAAEEVIREHHGQTDYISFVDTDTLLETKTALPRTRIVLAVKIGNTRFIDNSSIS